MNKKSLFVLTALLLNASSAHSSIVSSVTINSPVIESFIKSQTLLCNVASAVLALAIPALALTIIDNARYTIRRYLLDKAYDTSPATIAQKKLDEEIRFQKAVATKLVLEQAIKNGDYKVATEVKTTY